MSNSNLLIKKQLLYVIWLAGCLCSSLCAEDDIQKGLVYFAPPVFISEKTLPCQGLFLPNGNILTSPSCYTKTLAILKTSVLRPLVWISS